MMLSNSFGIGDLVYVKKKPNTAYSWHFNYPRTNFIGLIMEKVDGWSYCMVYLKIVYPDSGMSAWTGWNISQRRKNYWDYDNTDLKCKVDLNSLSNIAYNKILSRLL